MIRRSWLLFILLALGCPETPPDPAANLRLPSGLAVLPRTPEDSLLRSDVLISDSEADGVRILQFIGSSTFQFLRAPTVLAPLSVSAPGFPTDIDARADRTTNLSARDDRTLVLAPGAAVLHALQIPSLTFDQSPAPRPDPPHLRFGTLLLNQPRLNPAGQPNVEAEELPQLSLVSDLSQGDLDAQLPVGILTLGQVERTVRVGVENVQLVDTRVLVAFESMDGGGELVAIDVRTAVTSSAADLPDDGFTVDARSGRVFGVRVGGPEGGGQDLGARLSLPFRPTSMTRVRDGQLLVATTSSVGAVFDVRVDVDLAVSPELALAGDSIRVGGRVGGLIALAGTEVSQTDTSTRPSALEPSLVSTFAQGVVAFLAERSALVAIECPDSGAACQRVNQRFESPYLNDFATRRPDDDRVANSEPGLLVLRSPPPVVGAFGAPYFANDRFLDSFATRACVPVDPGEEEAQVFCPAPYLVGTRSGEAVMVFPPPFLEGDRDLVEPQDGGVLMLIHQDSIASFVVGPIDALRIAGTELLPAGIDNTTATPLPPEPRVEEVFERRVEFDTAEPGPDTDPLPVARTTILECRRSTLLPDGLPAEDEPPELPICGEDRSFEGGTVNPRFVDNRFSADEEDVDENRDERPEFEQEQGCLGIEADPVPRDTIYRATYRGDLLRAGSDLEVVSATDAEVELELPIGIDLQDDFQIRIGDPVGLFMNCRFPEDDDPDVLDNDRIEIAFFEGTAAGPAVVAGFGRRTLRVTVGQPDDARYVGSGASCPLVTVPDGTPEDDCPTSIVSTAPTSVDGLLAQCIQGNRELQVFNLSVYPGEEAVVLTAETSLGGIDRVVARQAIVSTTATVTFGEDLPLRFDWVPPPPDVQGAGGGFECTSTLGVDTRDLDIPPEVPNPRDALLGRPCTRSSECSTGRICRGAGTDCPGQCRVDCTSFSSCFFTWGFRACSSVEVQVNGFGPLLRDLGSITNSVPVGAVPDSAVYIPQRRSFLGSFPGSRSLRDLRLSSSGLSDSVID